MKENENINEVKDESNEFIKSCNSSDSLSYYNDNDN